MAWTSEGAIDIAELPERQLAARMRGEVLEVSCVDKFPKMTNYVVPAGVRIAHTARSAWAPTRARHHHHARGLRQFLMPAPRARA